MIPSAPPLVLRGHQGAVYDLAWHESTGCWISAGGDGVLAAWKHGEEHGKALAHHSSPFYALTLWKGMVVGGNSTGELIYTRRKARESCTFIRPQSLPCLQTKTRSCGVEMVKATCADGSGNPQVLS